MVSKKTFKVNDKQRSSAIIASAITKMSIYKEALASCHLEGIGKGLTINDLYLWTTRDVQKAIESTAKLERQAILAELKKQKIECQEGCEDHDAYNAVVDAMIRTVEKMTP